MVNQSESDFYTHLLFRIDSLPQYVGYPLYMAAAFFNNLRPDFREFLISEGVHVYQGEIMETNHQGNQRLLLVRNAVVEA